MKSRYSCKAATLIIVVGAALFRPYMMKAQPSPAPALKSNAAPAASDGHAIEEYGRLPLGFEPNQGQTDGRVKFLTRGRGYTLFLTADEAVLSLRHAAGEAPATGRQRGGLGGTTSQVLRMRLVGANPGAAATAADELPGKSNYFLGSDPKKWRTDVANYAKVKYRDVYPGVDMVYYGNQDGQLEYDFVVAPGADLSAIKLEVSTGPVPPLTIAPDGGLVVKIEGGEVRFHKPVVYQTDSTNGRQLLEGHYTVDSENHVRFRVARYNHSRALCIDPVLSYSTYLGGTNIDQGNAIAVDSSGSAYIAGYTYSTDFPVLNGFQSSLQGEVSAFVTKLSADGSTLVYSTYLGGSAGASSAETVANGIAVDSSGSAYVTGYTIATNFPTQNPFQGSLQGAESAFVTKLSADGSSLAYSTYLGGPDTIAGTGLPPSPAANSAAAIAVDSSGSAYVTGFTNSTDFPTQNPYQSSCVFALFGNCDSPAFVTKLSADGSSLVYSTYLQGTVPGSPVNSGSYLTDVSPYAIAVDSSGNAYLTGETNSPVLPVTQNALLQNCVLAYYEASSYTLCYGYAFVTKLSADGSSLVYSTYLGGAIPYVYGQESLGTGIALDSAGQAYIGGWTNVTNFPTLNAFQGSLEGGNSAFVTVLTADGSALVYSTYLGGTLTGYGGASTTAAGIAVDSSGEVYIVGTTNTTDFPTANPLQPTCGSCDGGGTAFVTKFNAGGSSLAYSTYLGGSGGDGATAIAVDSTGNAYVTGSTGSTNFPTVNPFQATYAGGADAFVSKISIGPASQTITFGPLSNQPFGSAPFIVSATASSGLPVSFASTTPSVCTVSGSTVTLLATGTCTIQATQAGNANFAPATPVNQGFQVTPASQTITFGPLSNQVFGAPPFPVSATASSGLPVSFASTTTSVCTVSGSTVTLVTTGTCTIQATQAGNTNYAAAAPVNQRFQVTQASQTITFGALPNQVLGAAPFTVSATAGSGLAVSFASRTTSVCTVSGSTVTLIATGTCTIRATQAGNADYLPATPVNQSFRVTALTITTFNVPGAGTGNFQGTLPKSINTGGVIAGFYNDANSAAHGFVRTASGAITTFNVAGAGTFEGQGTFVSSINASGGLTGHYSTGTNFSGGYVRAANGAITIFEPSTVDTYPNSIDTAGVITGYYIGATIADHGFVRASNGAITTFDPPGSTETYAYAINTAQVITGSYVDASYVSHGFVRAANGTITVFDAPGAGAPRSPKLRLWARTSAQREPLPV